MAIATFDVSAIDLAASDVGSHISFTKDEKEYSGKLRLLAVQNMTQLTKSAGIGDKTLVSVRVDQAFTFLDPFDLVTLTTDVDEED